MKDKSSDELLAVIAKQINRFNYIHCANWKIYLN